MSLTKRFRASVEIGPQRFTSWITPTRRHYMACCDCQLTHLMEFRVIIDARGRPEVQFRARRAPRYTAQQRKRHGQVSAQGGTGTDARRRTRTRR